MDAGSRMHNHAGGLVDDDDLRVFVDYVERDVFGRERGRRGRGQLLDLDPLARAKLVRGLRGAARDENVAVLNRALERRPARRRDARGEERVEARARFLVRNFERERLGFHAGRGLVAAVLAHRSCRLRGREEFNHRGREGFHGGHGGLKPL